ncbi:hypothetical protein NDU88_004438 [Pleurodeles waltl]|uniref:Uncharacterized protein n=1 Tax=Pleurodeles waltl TaxID=8319 RepID=A0AAV7M6C2_PLEWA|nr:hypothetical protein NDU88_004438 [Pleurodeles waltl]
MTDVGIRGVSGFVADGAIVGNFMDEIREGEDAVNGSLSFVVSIVVVSAAAIDSFSGGAGIDGVMVINNVFVIFIKTFLVDGVVVERIFDIIIVIEARGDDNINTGGTADKNMAVAVLTTDTAIDKDVVNSVVD